jgi:hypothetical protein
MEHEQVRLDIITTAAAGTCHGIRSNAMSSRPQTRTSYQDFQENFKRSSKKDLQKKKSGSHKILQEPPMRIPELW